MAPIRAYSCRQLNRLIHEGVVNIELINLTIMIIDIFANSGQVLLACVGNPTAFITAYVRCIPSSHRDAVSRYSARRISHDVKQVTIRGVSGVDIEWAPLQMLSSTKRRWRSWKVLFANHSLTVTEVRWGFSVKLPWLIGHFAIVTDTWRGQGIAIDSWRKLDRDWSMVSHVFLSLGPVLDGQLWSDGILWCTVLYGECFANKWWCWMKYWWNPVYSCFDRSSLL